MRNILDDNLIYLIFSIVEEIPSGYVATYGQIAKLIGREKNARLIGRVLKMSSLYGNFPCHRVVNHNGRLVPGWKEQKILLQNENITFKDDSHVNLKKHLWKV